MGRVLKRGAYTRVSIDQATAQEKRPLLLEGHREQPPEAHGSTRPEVHPQCLVWFSTRRLGGNEVGTVAPTSCAKQEILVEEIDRGALVGGLAVCGNLLEV